MRYAVESRERWSDQWRLPIDGQSYPTIESAEATTRVVAMKQSEFDAAAHPVKRMRTAVDQLQYLGENDMGNLTKRQARRWHDATDKLLALVAELEVAP